MDYFNSTFLILLKLSENGDVILDANSAACQFYGYSHSDLINMTLSELECVELRPDEMGEGQKAHRLHCGAIKPVEVHLLPNSLLNDNGRLCLVQDISDRVDYQRALCENKELYLSLVNCLPLCVYRLDKEGRIIFANLALQNQLKMNKQDLLGKTAYDFYPEGLARKYREDDTNVFEAGQLFHEVEENINPSTGSRDFVEVIKVPVLDAHNKIVGLQGAFWNVTDRVNAEKKRYEREQLLKTVAEQSPDYVMLLDHRYQVVYLNRPMAFSGGQIRIGRSLPEMVPGCHKEMVKVLESALSKGEKGAYKTHWQDDSGNSFHFETRVARLEQPVLSSNGVLHLTCTDVSSRVRFEQELHQAATVFTHAKEAILITNENGLITDTNSAFSNITGYEEHEVINRFPRFLATGWNSKEKYQQIVTFVMENGYWQGELKLLHKNKKEHVTVQTAVSAVRDQNQEIQSFVILLTDISKQKKYQTQLEHIALYDPLTQLPNRLLLSKRLRSAMEQSVAIGKRLAVFYIDLDGFKEVNDRHGHQVGDRLLIDIAANMKSVLDDRDTVARLGGDEFVVVVPDFDGRSQQEEYLNGLLHAIAKPVHSAAGVIEVSASLGMTFYPQLESVDADHLIRQADVAMYQAKVQGKNRYAIFDTHKDRHQRDSLQVLTELKLAIAKGELILMYQPKVNMKSGEIVGVEALLRWQHPSRGLLLPDSFMPATLSHPIAVDIDHWVVNNVMKQVSEWVESGIRLNLSINVSIKTLEVPDFSQWLAKVLLSYPSVEASSIMLEVLESSAVEDVEQISLVIRASKVLGVRFSLDDFGMGYSTLNLLKKLPADELKIDRTFIRDMLHDADDLAIVKGVLGLASAFNKKVTAEGVESEEHGLALLEIGCEEAQGYIIAKPMRAEEFSNWVRDWKPFPSWREFSTEH